MFSEKKLYPTYFLIPALLIFLGFFILPALFGFYFAFTDWNAMNLNTFNFIGLDNFKYIFSNTDLTLALKNTLIFAVVTVILKNVVGLALALIADTNSFISKYYVRGVFYLPNFLNMVVIGVMFTAILHPTGPLNNFFKSIGLEMLSNDWLNNTKTAMLSVSLVEVWRTAGFHMVIFLAAIKSIPQDYYEAAKIDGANWGQRFRYILLPLITQGITINIIFSIISGLKVFDQVYILTNGGPGNSTQVVSTMVYKMFGNGMWGLGTAYNVLLTVVVFIITAIALYFMRRKEVEYN